MSLKEVFCQDRAIEILQRGRASGRAAHAYIFAGLEGVGKYKTAYEWAKLLLCQQPVVSGRDGESRAESCGSCESCALFEGGAHPDYSHVYKELLEFTREGKGRKAPVEFPIDVVREFVLEKVTIRPTVGNRRIFVVSEAEKLNASSQNALLKVLEEPPHYCTIILLCTRLEQLLPTTKSRCQIIRFGPISEDRIVARLTETGLDRSHALFFARLAQGSLGQACQWTALEREGLALFEAKKSIVTALASFQRADVLELAERFIACGKQVATAWSDLDKTVSKSDLSRRAQKTVIQILLSALHDAMMVNVMPEPALIHFDQATEIARLADRLDSEQAARCIDEGYEALRWIDANVNEKLIFERLLLRLARSAIITSKR
jgi:DNA polymerase III subunit delta'